MIRRILLVAALLMAVSKGNAQYVTLPNDAFKTFMRNNYASCFQFDPVTSDYLLDTTCIEMRNEDSLIVQNMGNFTSRVSLDPIRYFSSLKYLYTKSLYLNNCPPFPEGLEKLIFKSIDGSDLYGLPNGLRYLDCTQGDGITMNSVAKFPDSLRYLNCSSSPITVFPQISNTRLDTLICYLMFGFDRLPTGTLRNLPALPPTLKYLDCSQSALDSLPPLPDALEYLDCSSNYYQLTSGGASYRTLTQLPSLPPSLKILDCSSNALTALPSLPDGLVKLICGYTNLGQYAGISALPDLPSSLIYLECSQNAITALPNLPDNLEYLNIAANEISTITRFPDSLRYFHANGNSSLSSIPALPDHLTYLSLPLTNLTCLPHLPASLGGSSQYNSPASLNLIYSSNKIKCLPNLVNGIRTNQPLVLCTVTNNVNQCQSSPVVTGKVFYDIDGDGLKGPNEMYKSNVEISMNNSLYTSSNDSGFYNISADTGSSVMRINSGSLFFSTPDSFQFNFSSFDTTVFLDLPLRSTFLVDSLRITLTPLNNARPGFAVHFKVRFENTGTTLLAPVVSVDYDESLLAYDSSTNTGVANTSGVLTFSPGNLYPGQAGTFVSSFTLDPGASLGDSLTCLAKINASGFDDSARIAVVITGSYDPNDKNATPTLTPAAVVNGEFIDYLIRFQNTGTDTAFNVVITDTLSNFLVKESFEMITASHNCKVTRNNNALSFEFLNILLPDSNRNERLSHGFVRFKVKAEPGVALNTSIANFANIYFDYNSPVVTNTALTLVALPPGCFTVAATTTNSTCGLQNGTITVTPNGGVTPYTYTLNSGTPQASEIFTNVSPGTHIISIEDASGCIVSLTAVVDETPISATLTTTQATCSAGGTIEVTGSTGTAPFMYSIDGGTMQSAAIFDNLIAGSYVVLVQDANMCTYTETVTINVSPGTVVPTVSITSDATSVCSDEPVTFTATATNGGANPQYEWTVNGSVAGTNLATLTINPTVNSDVSVQLTSNDPCASPTTANSNVLSVTVNPAQTPSITITGNTSVDQGASTNITSSVVNGGSSPTYQWQDSTASHTWANITGATNASIDYIPQQSGDGLRAILTSTATCTSSSTVTSNALYFTVETTTTPRMRLYPNPVRSILRIENTNQTQWVSADILDDNGRKVTTFRNSSSATEVRMDVSMLMSGVYFIRLIDRNGKPEYFKFIKQ